MQFFIDFIVVFKLTFTHHICHNYGVWVWCRDTRLSTHKYNDHTSTCDDDILAFEHANIVMRLNAIANASL